VVASTPQRQVALAIAPSPELIEHHTSRPSPGPHNPEVRIVDLIRSSGLDPLPESLRAGTAATGQSSAAT
jgi:hypothetical protein